MLVRISGIYRGFASAAGGDKPRVFFGLTRLYSLRDRRIKQGAPQPRKVPFHRIGTNPPGTKYFCRDFQNPTTEVSNESFTIEYKPFADSDVMEKTKLALTRVLPGCRVTAVPVEGEPFRVVRGMDKRILMERPENGPPLELECLKNLVAAARKY